MDSFKYRSEMKDKGHRKKWDGKWDQNEKPADFQRAYVVSGRIELWFPGGYYGLLESLKYLCK